MAIVSTWIPVRVVGKTLTNADGTVRSLNPSSLSPPYGPYYWTAMPAGTAGAYETCFLGGGVAVYNPTGHQPVVFAFQASEPSGAAALRPDPSL